MIAMYAAWVSHIGATLLAFAAPGNAPWGGTPSSPCPAASSCISALPEFRDAGSDARVSGVAESGVGVTAYVRVMSSRTATNASARWRVAVVGLVTLGLTAACSAATAEPAERVGRPRSRRRGYRPRRVRRRPPRLAPRPGTRPRGLFAAQRGFLPGEDAPWITEIRDQLIQLLLRALECYAATELGLGGTELAGAERADRQLG